MTLEYAPRHLQGPDVKGVVYILAHEKAKKIATFLSEKQYAYLNEIQNYVGGSKTSTIQVLKALEKHQIITSKWEIKEFETKTVPTSRAIKVFRLNNDKEGLIKYYEPFLKSRA